MTTRKECFDALDQIQEALPNEWGGTKAKAIRDYIFSLEAYIQQVEEDYDEMYSKSGR